MKHPNAAHRRGDARRCAEAGGMGGGVGGRGDKGGQEGDHSSANRLMHLFGELVVRSRLRSLPRV